MALAPTRVKLEAGNNTLAIEWRDGHLSAYRYEYLRDRCPCSSCTGAEGGTPKTASGALPMFKKAVRPTRAEAVGRYALQIFWDDGHSTGIYTFPYLRELCQCAECLAIKSKTGSENESRH